MKEKPGNKRRLAQSDYRLLAEFRRVLRNFLAFSEGAARAAGLSPRQHQALLAVKGFDLDRAPTVGDLAERLTIRHHSAVGLVDRLVRGRLLARMPHPDDRRSVTLVLTARGESLLRTLAAVHRDELRRLAPTLRTLLGRLSR